MATLHPTLRRSPARPKQQRLPTWVLVTLVGLLAILVYGMMAPKTPSAFDRPEAQVNPPASPWSQPHAF